MKIPKFFEGRLKGGDKPAEQTDLEKWTGEVGEDTSFLASSVQDKTPEKKVPHLELVKNVEVVPVEKAVDMSVKNEAVEKRNELLLKLNVAQEEAKKALHNVANIRAQLEALDVDDARNKVQAA
jgi:hypothetical protein